MKFFNFKKIGKDKAPIVDELYETKEVFMVMPINDELYLKFSEENGRSKMTICDSKSHLDVTYSLTGQVDLFPNIHNISLVSQIIESRRKLY